MEVAKLGRQPPGRKESPGLHCPATMAPGAHKTLVPTRDILQNTVKLRSFIASETSPEALFSRCFKGRATLPPFCIIFFAFSFPEHNFLVHIFHIFFLGIVDIRPMHKRLTTKTIYTHENLN